MGSPESFISMSIFFTAVMDQDSIRKERFRYIQHDTLTAYLSAVGACSDISLYLQTNTSNSLSKQTKI